MSEAAGSRFFLRTKGGLKQCRSSIDRLISESESADCHRRVVGSASRTDDLSKGTLSDDIQAITVERDEDMMGIGQEDHVVNA